MSKEITVEVTDEDIGRGVRRHSGNCMVAEALKRAHPKADRVMVDIQTIRYTDTARDERLVWLTPPHVQDLIVAFDAGEFSRLHELVFRLRRSAAHRVQRQVPKTPGDKQRRNESRREMRNGEPGASSAGVQYASDVSAAAGSGVVPKSKIARRSPTTASRSYGRRALHVNQARERQGDLPPEPEPIPEA